MMAVEESGNKSENRAFFFFGSLWMNVNLCLKCLQKLRMCGPISLIVKMKSTFKNKHNKVENVIPLMTGFEGSSC